MDSDPSHGKTAFPRTSVIDSLTSDVVKAIVLFTWDNILGPKTLHIWTGCSPCFPPDGSDEACSSSYSTKHSYSDGKLPSVGNLLEKISDTAGRFFPAFGPNVSRLNEVSGVEEPGWLGKSYETGSTDDSAVDTLGVHLSDVSTSEGSTSFDPFITPELLSFSARLILNGEICKDWNSGNVDRKIISLPDRDVVINAFTFAVGSDTGLSIHSLALFIPLEERPSFLSMQRLVSSWMERLSRKLGVILEKTPSNIGTDAFSPYLEDFGLMLASLQEAGLPDEINLSDTLFSQSEHLHQDDGYFQFIRSAVASHVTTCGRSLVIGEDPCQMNKLIGSLAMFNTKHERKASRFVVKDRKWPYHHDLCIQGLLKENSHEVNIPTEEIYCSEFPTTVIDISNREVRRSLPCHEHNFRRYEICKQEIVNLFTGKSHGYKLRTSEMFSVADTQESFVDKLLKEICFLPSEDNIVQAYINHFMLLLQRKAVTFASFIEKETNEGRNPLKTSLKTIREHFGLTLDGDFHMVLACAEKLNFGMYAYLFGDPKEKNDEMRRIIDSF